MLATMLERLIYRRGANAEFKMRSDEKLKKHIETVMLKNKKALERVKKK